MVDFNQILPVVRNWLTSIEKETSFLSIDEIDSSIGTSIGLRRKQNEDRACMARLNVGSPNVGPVYLAIVCDGLGGMEGGADSAARVVSTVVASTFSQISNGTAPTEALIFSVKKSNEEIFSLYHGNGGTTLSVAMFLPNGTCISVNVGDSRIYLLKTGGSFIQLTTDDNVASEVQQIGAISPENLDLLEFGEHLTQFVGIGPEIRIQAKPLEIGSDDNSRLVLASDGAWRATNGTFGKVVLNASSANDIVKRAINLSNWCGGIDNTTILVTGRLAKMARDNPTAHHDLGMLPCLDIWTPSGHSVFFVGNTNGSTALRKEPDLQSKPYFNFREVAPSTKSEERQEPDLSKSTPQAKTSKAKVKKTTKTKKSTKKPDEIKSSSEAGKQFNIEIIVDDPANKNAKNPT